MTSTGAASWNLRALADRELADDRDYWRRTLEGASACRLALDRQPSADEPVISRRLDEALDPVAFERLTRVAGNNGTRAFALLLAALQILLRRHTRSDQVIVGSTIHRSHAEVGAINRILALRQTIDGRMTMRAFVANVQTSLQGAYAHQKYPFENALKLIGLDPPLFNVAIVLDGIHDLADLSEIACDLTLQWGLNPDGAGCTCHYNERTLQTTTVQAFVSQYLHVVSSLLAAPELTVAALPCAPDAEIRRLTLDFNDTTARYDDRPVHLLIDAQAASTPDAIAVAHGQACVSYAELQARAHALADHLQQRGVQPGQRIGLSLEHSVDLLVAILGILNAGCAYVPIDPVCPPMRAAFMLRDASIGIVVTQTALRGQFSESGVDSMCLEDAPVPGAIAGHTRGERPSAQGSDLAYVMYTSGSSGQPKGVEISHRALTNYATWARRVYVGDRALTFALYSSIGFDLTVTSMFVPLISGGRIEVYARSAAAPALLRILEEDRVDIIKATPSHLSLIRQQDHRRSGVSAFIIGGESLDRGLARQIWNNFGGRARLFNEYGPTEATVGCMLHELDPARDWRDAVPIGRPAANVQIYVLDDDLQPLGLNMVGQIAIAGDGLARGYLGNETLTANSFVETPWMPGRRLYLTGDLGRHLPEGGIEYLGRHDDQVKVRGTRIQLGEIQHALNSHPGVRDSLALLADAPAAGEAALIAYYVSRSELDHRELRSFLAMRLLPEAVPAMFVHLRKMPLTLNGKIDRDALPPPRIAAADERTPPAGASSTEELVAGIFSQTLRSGPASVDDSFFELGGHSLLATQVMSRLRAVFGVELKLRVLFEAPTVKSLAQHVDRAIETGRRRALPPLRPARRDGEPIPLSFAQQRLWLIDQLEPGSAAYNVPFALRLNGRLDVPALARGVGEIVRRHEILRTCFPIVDDRPCQRIDPPRAFALPIVDLRDAPAADAIARQLVAQEADRRFDLARGPLMRVRLLRLREDAHVLLVTLHHVICDGWSIGILVRELTMVYEAFREGRPSPLGEPGWQYADFAVWQREWLTGDVLDEQLSYWRSRFDGIRPLKLPGPRVHARGPERTVDVATIAVGAGESASLRAASQQHGVTLFMLLLTAFQLALRRWTGQNDIAVGTDVANRNRLESESIVGFFVNQLVLRTELAGATRFGELLMRVRDDTLGAYAHQDVPFEKLVEEMGRSPIAQVKFVLQNAPVERFTMAGVDVSALPTRPSGAKFDVMLNMTDAADGLRGTMQYDPGIVSPAAARWVLGFYQALLSTIASSTSPADVQIDALLADTERRLVSTIQQQLDRASADVAATEAISLAREQWRMGLGAAPPDGGGPFEPTPMRVALPPSLATDIEKLSAARGVNAIACYVAVWCLLSHRISGLSSVVAGFALNDGMRPRVVPFRSALPPDREASFGSLLSATAATLTEMQALRLDRHWDRVERLEMTVQVCQGDDGLSLALWYDRHAVDRAQASRMSRRYLKLLATIAAAPDISLCRVDVLDAEERRLLTLDWARSPWTADANVPIHRLFEQQAQRSPDRVAVTHGDARLTYAELNVRANGLAHRLARLGVRSDVLVLVCVDRSAEALIALLGVLKAGGVYIPVDDDCPRERLARILDDSSAHVVVMTMATRGMIVGDARTTIYVDEDAPAFAGDEENPVWTGDLDDLAYVIYTSGSQGLPKGVMIHHRGLANYLTWCTDAYRLADGAGAPVHSSLSFDLPITSLFPPLLSGGQVELIAHALDMDRVSGGFRRDGGYSLMKITPAHLTLLTQQLAGTDYTSMTHALIVGGEPLTSEQVSAWRRHAPLTRIVNEYGPTETVVGCCVYDVPHGPQPSATMVPIGRPIANTTAYVLDRDGEPAPIGVAGELYIGGVGVGRGYLNAPDITAVRFLPDPFSDHAGARLYRTGDRARWSEAGLLEYLGRIDDQLKIRGFRVEPGEIAVTLARCADLDACAVVAVEDDSGERRLVAYVVPRTLPAPSEEALRESIRHRLPDYMMPSAFVVLERLPLTPNGKVDRHALPAVPASARETDALPRTATQEIVAGIWSHVLAVSPIGLHDNFFELGGHSMAATHVIARIRRAFQIDFPVRALFESPTVGELAADIDRGGGAALPAIARVSRDRVLPLSFGQQRLWYLDQLQPGAATYNLPFGIRFAGPLHVGALAGSLTDIVRRHEALRTSFTERDGQPIQRIAPPAAATAAVDVADLATMLTLSAREAMARRLADREAQRPFDLARGPLLRATLIRLAPDDHILLITVHHIVCDGASIGILIGDFTRLYAARVSGRPARLDEPVIQYADFAAWQHDWMQGDILEAQLAWWRQRLQDASPLRLPADRPRTASTTDRGETVPFSIPADVADRLRRFSQQEGATLFMTLLAAFDTVLHRWTHQRDIIVGSPRDNRDQMELENVVGFFVNTLPLRATVAPGLSFRGLVRQVRETVLGAFAHDQVPFERMLETLRPRNVATRSPLLRVWFVVQNRLPMPPATLPDVVVTPFLSEMTPARFEIALVVSPAADGLNATLTYAADLFEPDTIQQLIGRFQSLLAAVVEDPDAELAPDAPECLDAFVF